MQICSRCSLLTGASMADPQLVGQDDRHPKSIPGSNRSIGADAPHLLGIDTHRHELKKRNDESDFCRRG